MYHLLGKVCSKHVGECQRWASMDQGLCQSMGEVVDPGRDEIPKRDSLTLMLVLLNVN